MPFNDREMERGYGLCDCGKGVHLLQAGTEAKLYMCAMCKIPVADRDTFFIENNTETN
jgi:hypothetical protein